MGVIGGPDPIVQDGLVFALDPFNKKCYPISGSIVTDIINNNVGSFNNTQLIADSSSFGNIVLNYNQGNQYIDYTSTAVPNLSGSFTIGAWVKTSESGDVSVLTSFGSSPYPGFDFAVRSGRIALYAANTAGSGNFTSADGTMVNDNVMRYIVASYNGSSVSFYNNGVLDSTISKTGTADNSVADKLLVGQSNLGSRQYAGLLGPLHVYTRTLSAAEVLQNYNTYKDRFT